PLQRDERRRRPREDRRVVMLEAPLLPEVQPREAGSDGEAGEGRQDESDVEDEEDARVVGPSVHGEPAGRTRYAEENRGQRRDTQPEQPEARRATPAEIDADDEPDEEVQQASPALPGQPSG